MALGEAKNLVQSSQCSKPFLRCLCAGFLSLPSPLSWPSCARVGHHSGQLTRASHQAPGFCRRQALVSGDACFAGQDPLPCSAQKGTFFAVFAIKMCPCRLSTRGKVRKGPGMLRASRIPQNVVSHVSALQEGCPTPRLGKGFFGLAFRSRKGQRTFPVPC